MNLLHFGGSFTNHACRCHIGHVLDVFGMYAAIWFLTALAGAQLCLRNKCNMATQQYSMFAAYLLGLPLLWKISQYYYVSPEREPMVRVRLLHR